MEVPLDFVPLDLQLAGTRPAYFCSQHLPECCQWIPLCYKQCRPPKALWRHASAPSLVRPPFISASVLRHHLRVELTDGRTNFTTDRELLTPRSQDDFQVGTLDSPLPRPDEGQTDLVKKTVAVLPRSCNLPNGCPMASCVFMIMTVKIPQARRNKDLTCDAQTQTRDESYLPQAEWL